MKPSLFVKIVVPVIFLTLVQTSEAKTKKPDDELKSLVEEKMNLKKEDSSSWKTNSDFFKAPLSLKKALFFALHHNPELKSYFAQMSLSQAEMKELGLVESPEIEFGARFPVSSPGSKTAYDLNVTYNILDLIQLPSRKNKGKADYESKKWEGASNALRFLTDIKIAFYNYQGALQLHSFWQSNLLAAKAAANLAKEQRNAGNINSLDESQNIFLYKMADLESRKSLSEVKQARLVLAKLLGLSAEDNSWKIVGSLSSLPKKEISLDVLKEWALTHRPDLLAQQQKIKSSEAGVTLAKNAILPQLNLGVNTEWDAEGSQGVGPMIQVGLPFLGHRRVGIQKAKADLHYNKQVLAALEQGTPYDLEHLYQQMKLAREMLNFYHGEVLPLQQHLMDESIKHYNYMLLGNYELLETKQNQMNAKRDSILALRNYWVARAELENFVGRSLAPLKNGL